MSQVSKFLKKSLQQQKSSPDIDDQLFLHCQHYLTDHIEFTPALQTDSHLQQLKEKYQPINRLATSMERTSHELCVGDIPKPRQVLFNPDHLQMKWRDSRKIGSGLYNMGNTCFLNSVLQCLTYTPPLCNYFLTADHKTNCTIQGFCVMCELQSHMERVRNSEGVVKPLPIVQNLKVFAKHLRYGRQEDAHEFLRYFIDALQKVCLDGLPAKLDIYSKHTTLVHQIFGGYHRSQVTCLKCHRTSNTYDPLLDISLDIKGCSTLVQALKFSVKPDTLDEENKYACPFCKELTKAKKQLTIYSPPNVLTIQLKRFEYTTLFGGKINKLIQYPQYLNIRPFMSEAQGSEEWYRLYAVLVHFGFSCHSGHYYCYIRNSNGIWYSMNDAMVNQVSSNTVLSQEAYLLFYVKDKDYAPVSSSSTAPQEKKKPDVTTAGVKVDSSSLYGVSVKRDPCTSVESNLVRPKPTGIVNPSPKLIPSSPPPPPPPPSHSPPPSPHSPPPFQNVSSQITSQNPTPTLQIGSVAPPTASVATPTSSMVRPKFTPRSVATPKQANDKIGPHGLTKESSVETKKPKVAYVTPMAHKPIARVPPSPQIVPDSPAKAQQDQFLAADQENDVSAAVMYGPELPPDFVQASSPNWTVTAAKEKMLPEVRKEKVKVVFSKKRKAVRQPKENGQIDSSDDDTKTSYRPHHGHHHKNEETGRRQREKYSSSEDEEIERKISDHSRRKKHKKHRRHHSQHETDSDFELNRKHLRRSSPDRSRKRHSSPEHHRFHKRGRSSSADKHRDKIHRRRDETKKTNSFDSTRNSKDVRLVAHSGNVAAVVDSLEKPDQLGSGVKTWGGEKNSVDSSKATKTNVKKRGRDEWDMEIDKGKTKKIKKKSSDKDWDTTNRFQKYQSKRNSKGHKKRK